MVSSIIWEKAQAIFEQAISLLPEDQQALLTESNIDEDVKAAVNALLNAHTMGTQLAFSPVLDQIPTALYKRSEESLKGTRLGAYVLTKKIAEGGMGEIFLAQRDDGEFQKQVVVKLIRHSLFNNEVHVRFQRERQILADLEHPNITRLIDAGKIDEHLYYVVMEYIQGENIYSYCRTHQLSVKQRVKLFLKLCSAVQYAHQNLIIHRDIKPSNVLVDSTGEPRLLDFGIATLVHNKASVSTEETIAYTQPRTPLYSSPEQINGNSATTATDVYALGVVLYEMLSGQRPFAHREAQPIELERAICQETPNNPSHALRKLIAAHQKSDKQTQIIEGINHSQAVQHISGDLDRIILKALAYESVLRYATVKELQLDLEAYLEGRPVIAVTPSVGYRIRKFITRHWVPVSMATVGFIAVISFTIITLFQSEQLRLERDLARQEQTKSTAVTDLLLNAYESSDPTITSGQDISAKTILDRSLEKIDDTLATQPDTQANLKVSMATVYQNLNDYDTAKRIAIEAVDILESLPGRQTNELARAHYILASIYQDTTEDDIGLEHVTRALNLLRSNNILNQELLLDAQLIQADLTWSIGSGNEAISLMRNSLDGHLRHYGPEHDKTINNQFMLATLLDSNNQSEEALSIAKQALGIQQKNYQSANHITASLLSLLANIHYWLDQSIEAEPFANQALNMRIEIFGETHYEVAKSLTVSAKIHAVNDNFDQAILELEKALVIFRELFDESDIRIALLLFNIGQHFLYGSEDIVTAEKYLLEAINKAEMHYTSPHINLAHLYHQTGNLYLKKQELTLAEKHYQQAIEIFFSKGDSEKGNTASVEIGLAEIYHLRGQDPLALDIIERASPILKERFGEHNQTYIRSRELWTEIQAKTPM